jgi:hypothetical protein
VSSFVITFVGGIEVIGLLWGAMMAAVVVVVVVVGVAFVVVGFVGSCCFQNIAGNEFLGM